MEKQHLREEALDRARSNQSMMNAACLTMAREHVRAEQVGTFTLT